MRTSWWRAFSVAAILGIVSACSSNSERPAADTPAPAADSPAPATGTPAPAPQVQPSTEPAESVDVVSEFLQRAQYAAGSRTLTLYFKDGSVYQYAAVPESIFRSLRTYPKDASVTFNKSIRGRFKFERLKAATPRTTKAATSGPPPRPPAPIRCPKEMPRRNVVSTVLDAVAYDAATRCLVLYFDSRHVYRYGSVPPEVYQQMLAPNANFNDLIRNRTDKRRFPFERVR